MLASCSRPFLLMISSVTVMVVYLWKGFFLCYLERSMIGLLVEPILTLPLDCIFLMFLYECEV